MSDHPRFRVLALALLVGAAPAAHGQTLAEWRATEATANAALGAAAARLSEFRDRRNFGTDAAFPAGTRRVMYVAGKLSSRDSSAIAEGILRAEAVLEERFGATGLALRDTNSFVAEVDDRRLWGQVALLELARPNGGREYLQRPVDPNQVTRYVLRLAGDHLVDRRPAFRSYAGFATIVRDTANDADVWRRLATSWAAAGRRCATGAVSACGLIAERFDAATAIDRYFDPSDYRAVMVSARTNMALDSTFQATRRRCLDDESGKACGAIIRRVEPVDPFGPFVRGTMLAKALEIGGRGALDRLDAERSEDPLVLLAAAAGTSTDSVLIAWRNDMRDLVRSGPDRLIKPILSSLVWAALLLVVAMRRRFA